MAIELVLELSTQLVACTFVDRDRDRCCLTDCGKLVSECADNHSICWNPWGEMSSGIGFVFLICFPILVNAHPFAWRQPEHEHVHIHVHIHACIQLSVRRASAIRGVAVVILKTARMQRKHTMNHLYNQIGKVVFMSWGELHAVFNIMKKSIAG